MFMEVGVAMCRRRRVMHRDFTNYMKYYLCKLAQDNQKMVVYWQRSRLPVENTSVVINRHAFDSRLIQAVRSKPILYNTTLKKFRNKTMKEIAWKSE